MSKKKVVWPEYKPNEVVNVPFTTEAQKSYHTCLKMIFVDLVELNNPDVAKILNHYNFGFTGDGRVGIELPRYRPSKRKK